MVRQGVVRFESWERHSPLAKKPGLDQIDIPNWSRGQPSTEQRNVSIRECVEQSAGVMLFSQCARMAELADAPDSKSGGRKAVWVRPPLRAPFKRLEGLMLLVRGYCYHCKTTTTLEVTHQGIENAIEGKCCVCNHPFAGALLP